MNPDPQSRVTTITYDASKPWATTIPGDGTDPAEPPPKPRTALFDFEHDPDKGIFRIKWPDGESEVFRDKPVRHLVLEPDPESGEMKPVVKRGCPTYLYLSREEREVR